MSSENSRSVEIKTDGGVVEVGRDRRVHSAAGGGEMVGDSDSRRQNGVGGGQEHAPDFAANKNDTLLVVATLITTLAYQLGTNIPGGYWQDDKDGHVAGTPIIRTKDVKRYWLFMAASWVGFGSSMLLTVCLLTGVPSRSRAVQWPFVVAYSSLVLAFIASQTGTLLSVDLLIWAAVLGVLAIGIRYRRLDRIRHWLFAPDR